MFALESDQSPAEAVPAVHGTGGCNQDQRRLPVFVLKSLELCVGMLTAGVQHAVAQFKITGRDRHLADDIVRIVRIYE